MQTQTLTLFFNYNLDISLEVLDVVPISNTNIRVTKSTYEMCKWGLVSHVNFIDILGGLFVGLPPNEVAYII